MKRRLLATAAMVGLVVVFASCGEQRAEAGQATRSVGQNATPTATVYSTPTDTPTPQPTATPAPPGSLPSGTSVVFTDFQGFRFSVREQTGSFSPTYVDGAGNSYTAPPGSDMLVLHFMVRNLLTDRPGIFQGLDFDAVGIYGSCVGAGGAWQSPTGQCLQNQNWAGWIGSVPDGNELTIPPGGSAQFDYATQYRMSTDITAMTMWIINCKGDGNFEDCSLPTGADSAIPLAGGVLLSAPTNS